MSLAQAGAEVGGWGDHEKVLTPSVQTSVKADYHVMSSVLEIRGCFDLTTADITDLAAVHTTAGEKINGEMAANNETF